MTEEKFIIRIVIPILACLLAASIIMLAGYGSGEAHYEIAAFFVANIGVALVFAINLGVTVWHRYHHRCLRNGS